MPSSLCSFQIIGSVKDRLRFRTSYTRLRLPIMAQILGGEPGLLHAELDGLDGVGQVDGEMLRFVGLNEGGQYIQAVAVGCADVGVALHQPGDFV